MEEVVSSFKEKASSISPGIRTVAIDKNTRDEVEITSTKVDAALAKITKPKNIKMFCDNLQSHFSSLSPWLSLCSSPKAFRTAWGLRSKVLSPQDAEAIINDGGQLVPVNLKSRILKYEEQGVLLSDKKLLLGVRHSEGNYDDNLDELGRFIYQPPKNVSGMLQYRWAQHLSSELKIPYVLLAIMWFKYEIDSNINHLFVLSPVKVINFKKDLVNLNSTIQNPLELQLMQRNEATTIVNQIKSLNSNIQDIKIREPLDELISREWSYDKINSSKKGLSIKRWAQKNGHICPGEFCNHTNFRELKTSDIAFGHIISQNWSTAFTFVNDKVHHPDNLYLTCKRCNSSLSDSFPDKNLKKEIEKSGTIGDWLRSNVEDIRTT